MFTVESFDHNFSDNRWVAVNLKELTVGFKIDGEYTLRRMGSHQWENDGMINADELLKIFPELQSGYNLYYSQGSHDLRPSNEVEIFGWVVASVYNQDANKSHNPMNTARGLVRDLIAWSK